MRRSIIHRRKRSRINKEFELQLTSMMDMLIIILVFMLKSYSLNAVAFATSSNITLPTSSAEELPVDSLNLVIEPTGIIFDNERIVEFKLPQGVPPPKPEMATYEIDPRLLSDGGLRIIPLFDAMVKAREKSELLMSKVKWVAPKVGAPGEKVEVPPKFQGLVYIQADKSVKYELIKKIMYTSGAAQYKIFKLVALRKDAQ